MVLCPLRREPNFIEYFVLNPFSEEIERAREPLKFSKQVRGGKRAVSSECWFEGKEPVDY